MGTVNFEDLFDFSPEPVDRDQGEFTEEQDQHQDHHQHHHQQQYQNHHQTDLQRLNLLKTPPLHSPVGGVHNEKHSISQRNTTLSASLPIGHGTNLSASYTGSSSPGSSVDFMSHVYGSTESFGHQTEDLSGVMPGSSVGSENKGKRGRKPGQKSSRPDVIINKLERSRQSARECRARKKLRYQYLDDMILERERANLVLKNELLRYQAWCHELDKGKIPDGLKEFLRQMKTPRESEPPYFSQ